MVKEVVRKAIVDWDGGNKLASVVESISSPWKYWLIMLNPDGTRVWPFLKLDQTTPQTIINWAPIFNKWLFSLWDVWIGTTTPLAKLHIENSSAETYARIFSWATQSKAGIEFGWATTRLAEIYQNYDAVNTSYTTFFNQRHNQSWAFKWQLDSVDKMTLDKNWNLWIW